VPENHQFFPLIPLPVAQVIPHSSVLPVKGLRGPIRKLRENLREIMDSLEDQLGRPSPFLPAPRTRPGSQLGRRRALLSSPLKCVVPAHNRSVLDDGSDLTASSIRLRTRNQSPYLVDEIAWRKRLRTLAINRPVDYSCKIQELRGKFRSSSLKQMSTQSSCLSETPPKFNHFAIFLSIASSDKYSRASSNRAS
jgi:hypothetical protein